MADNATSSRDLEAGAANSIYLPGTGLRAKLRGPLGDYLVVFVSAMPFLALLLPWFGREPIDGAAGSVVFALSLPEHPSDVSAAWTVVLVAVAGSVLVFAAVASLMRRRNNGLFYFLAGVVLMSVVMIVGFVLPSDKLFSTVDGGWSRTAVPWLALGASSVIALVGAIRIVAHRR